MSTFYVDETPPEQTEQSEEPPQTEDSQESPDDYAVDTEEFEVLAKTFKIIIIGDSNVGKTCLAYRLCTGKFPERTETTIGVDFWEKSLELNGEFVKLQLWDTAGQERFRKSMVCHYYRNVNAVVFMYDITRKCSFEALTTWIVEYRHHAYSGDVPKILIGNKCDLGLERTVSSNIARKFADSHNMPLWEISIKNDAELEQIEAIFLTLTHKLLKHKPLMNRERTMTADENVSDESKVKRRSRGGSKKPIKLAPQNSIEKKKCTCN